MVKFNFSVRAQTLFLLGLGFMSGCFHDSQNGLENTSYRVKGELSKNAKANQIIFIMTDTQRWDMLGVVNKSIKTPNLDNLALSGMRFNLAYTCSPVCTPARSSIFTGTYPHTNGAWGNDMGLAGDVKTIGQRLTDNGYHCAYAGKWHLDGTDYFGNGVCPDGWDPEYWFDGRNYLDELSREEKYRSRQGETIKENIDINFTYAHRVSDRALKFLEENGNSPFFLVVSYDEPHHPFLCPEPFASMYKDFEWPKNPSHYDDLKGKPYYQQLWAEGRQLQDKDKMKIIAQNYFGCNSFVDYEIGRLLKAVEEKFPDALIIYTSDHGDFLEAHSLKAKGPCVYDDVARIPFIVKWKGHAPVSTVSNQLVSHINIVPTILEAAGLEIPDFIQGKSIVPSITNADVKTQDEVFIEFGRFEVDHDGFGAFEPLRAVFDGRFKLSINLLSTDELYDLKTDPFELKNLIDSSGYAEVRTRLHRKILDFMGDTRDPFRGTYWEARSWNKGFKPSWEYTGITRVRKEDGYNPRSLDYNTGYPVKDYSWQKELVQKK